MELFRTERLILREWEESDAKRLADIASTEHIAHWLLDWRECEEWALPWIQGTVTDGYAKNNPMDHFMTWAIVHKQSDELIGMINIGNEEYENKEVGTGYFIDINYENHGYITEAVAALCDYAFNNWHYKHIVATISPGNTASIAVAQKVGFKYDKDIITDSGGNAEPIIKKLFRLSNPEV